MNKVYALAALVAIAPSLAFAQAALPQPYDLSTTSQYIVFLGGRSASEEIVRISLDDGHVTFGPGYTADDATSRKFWELVGAQYPSVCKR